MKGCIQGFTWKGISDQDLDMGIQVNDEDYFVGQCRALEDLVYEYVQQNGKRKSLHLLITK